jgi:cobalt-zinc-cadmium efflux system outer membrane protein
MFMNHFAPRRWARAFGVLAAALPGCLHTADRPRLAETVGPVAARPLDLSLAAEAIPPEPPKPPPPQPGGPGLQRRLVVPPELPGAEVPPIQLPPLEPGNREARARAIEKLYRPLPALDGDVPILPGPGGRPLDLPTLQRMAAEINPALQQAATDVEASRGNAIQAGLYPNPNFGTQDDQIAAVNRPGQLGVYFEQLIKTAGKLTLARAIETMNYVNAQVALRRAQVDLAAKVRGAYFAVLVAQESVRIGVALTRFTEEVYRVYVEQVKVAGLAAPYEPLALRAQAAIARTTLAQARNRYVAAWEQLALAVGRPDLPPTQLAGRPDLPVPHFDYLAARARIWEVHTDVVTARNTVTRQQYALRQAQVQVVPDIATHIYVQQDLTDTPQRLQGGIQIGGAVPIWDQNKGGILAARASLARAELDVDRARLDLATTLTDAFERYENNRTLVRYYRDVILPDQVQVYRGLLTRYQQEPDKVGLTDIAQAQQAVVASLASYLSALTAQWQAVVDLAAVAQLDDLTAVSGPLDAACEGPPLHQMLQPGVTGPALTLPEHAAPAEAGKAPLPRLETPVRLPLPAGPLVGPIEPVGETPDAPRP